jgi:hypothetical protein
LVLHVIGFLGNGCVFEIGHRGLVISTGSVDAKLGNRYSSQNSENSYDDQDFNEGEPFVIRCFFENRLDFSVSSFPTYVMNLTSSPFAQESVLPHAQNHAAS